MNKSQLFTSRLLEHLSKYKFNHVNMKLLKKYFRTIVILNVSFKTNPKLTFFNRCLDQLI